MSTFENPSPTDRQLTARRRCNISSAHHGSDIYSCLRIVYVHSWKPRPTDRRNPLTDRSFPCSSPSGKVSSSSRSCLCCGCTWSPRGHRLPTRHCWPLLPDWCLRCPVWVSLWAFPCTHSLAFNCPPSLIHSLLRSLTPSLTPSLAHSLARSLAHSHPILLDYLSGWSHLHLCLPSHGFSSSFTHSCDTLR